MNSLPLVWNVGAPEVFLAFRGRPDVLGGHLPASMMGPAATRHGKTTRMSSATVQGNPPRIRSWLRDQLQRLWEGFHPQGPRSVGRTGLSRALGTSVGATGEEGRAGQGTPWGWHVWWQAIKDFVYGATLFEMAQDLRRERARREELMVLLVFGSFLGVPVIPPYPALRLIPHIIPFLGNWRRRMLREKDLTDLLDHELG